MRVDQAGHQGPAIAIDDDGIGAAIYRDGLGRDLFDLVAANQDVCRRGQRVALAVEDAHVLEQHRSFRGLGGRAVHRGYDKERDQSDEAGVAPHDILRFARDLRLTVSSRGDAVGWAKAR
jgi:hypothetical protein